VETQRQFTGIINPPVILYKLLFFSIYKILVFVLNQDYFGTSVGANVYLTPPDSQGFAPHYDDSEAFILQLEGYEHWKLYRPRNKREELPRVSSKNFNEDDYLGETIIDVVLGPGDLLYYPRGTIHQATTVEGEHSLHITLSTYQSNTYADLLTQVSC